MNYLFEMGILISLQFKTADEKITQRKVHGLIFNLNTMDFRNSPKPI